MITIDKRESDFLSSVKFICILTIVMVHCSLHDSDYIKPLLNQEEIPNLFSWYCSLHFGEVALRLFFIISGYLFFRSVKLESFNWKKDYFFKLKNRFYGLFVLYAVWNTIGLITTYLITKQCPTDILTLLNGYNPFNQGNYFGRGLWFLESLIIFSLLSPFYYLAIKYLRHLIPILCLLLSLTGIRIDFLYFNMYLLLGAYLACTGINLVNIGKSFNWKISLILILLIQALIRTNIINMPVAESFSIFLFLSVFTGILYKHPIPRKIAVSSTFIYVAHFYSTMTLKRAFLFVLPQNLFGYVTNMILNCTLTVLICIFAYSFIIKRFRFLNFLFSGGVITKQSDTTRRAD